MEDLNIVQLVEAECKKSEEYDDPRTKIKPQNL